MVTALNIPARNNSGNAIVDLIDVGSINNNGYMQIRTAPRPATPYSPATGTLLATLPFSNPAFGNFNSGMAIANPIGEDNNLAATGRAAWFRVYDRDNQPVFDGSISVSGGDGDITFDIIDFVQGGKVSLSSWAAIMPE